MPVRRPRSARGHGSGQPDSVIGASATSAMIAAMATSRSQSDALGHTPRPDGPHRALVTGATGFIGGRLAAGARRRRLGGALPGARPRRGPATSSGAASSCTRATCCAPETLRGAGRGVDVAYYLVHSMGRGGRGDFAERERAGAEAFARMARAEGVERVVYLGGLGDRPAVPAPAQPPRDRAALLAEHGPPLTYFRAGDGRRRRERVLPHAALPRAAAAGDDRAGLAEERPPSRSRSTTCSPTSRRRPRSPPRPGARSRSAAPTSSPTARCSTGWPRRSDSGRGRSSRCRCSRPWLSSLWIGLVTPVDAGVARPLIEGLSTPTIVTDPSGATLFDVEPISFREALRRAVDEDPGKHPAGRD